MGSEAEAAQLHGPRQQELHTRSAPPAPPRLGHPPRSSGTPPRPRVPPQPLAQDTMQSCRWHTDCLLHATLALSSSCQPGATRAQGLQQGNPSAAGDPPSSAIPPAPPLTKWLSVVTLSTPISWITCSLQIQPRSLAGSNQHYQVEIASLQHFTCHLLPQIVLLHCTFPTFHTLLLMITCLSYYKHSHHHVPSVKSQSIAFLFTAPPPQPKGTCRTSQYLLRASALMQILQQAQTAHGYNTVTVTTSRLPKGKCVGKQLPCSLQKCWWMKLWSK